LPTRTVGGVTTNSAARGSAPTARQLIRPPYRGTTIGLLLVITVVAYEAMAVATAMPRAVAALHGLAFYGWPFTAFLMANVVGIVTGGELADRDGPHRPLLAGMAIFTAGLLLSGFAPSMAVFVAGRAVQGLGSGLVIVAVYVVIAEVYDEILRPRMFAALSAAWVLPALVGPVISGALTQHLTWRLVFLVIPPFVVVALVLVRPALRTRPAHDLDREPARLGRWRFALLAAAGIAIMQYAGQHLRWWSLLLLVAGVALLAPALRVLFPAGTLRIRRGLPAVVAFRGMVAGAFFAVDSYVPLTLTDLHRYGPTEAGLPLMLGALGWSSGSWWQGRRPDVARHRIIRAGFALVAIAALGMTLLTVPHLPGWISYPIWLVGGTGMGLVMPTLSVLLLEKSPVAERGQNSAAFQICDVMTSAVCIGLGGVLVAAAEHGTLSLRGAVGVIDVSMAVFAFAGAALAGRVVTTARAGGTAG
jgi:MFS family permease